MQINVPKFCSHDALSDQGKGVCVVVFFVNALLINCEPLLSVGDQNNAQMSHAEMEVILDER